MHITDEIEDLMIGETRTLLCPKCGGGKSGELSFSVTRTEQNELLYNCFRASCNFKGFSPSTKINFTNSTKIKDNNVIHNERRVIKTCKLSIAMMKKLEDKYGIDEFDDWYYTPNYGGRVAMSVLSPKGTHRGWILRDVHGNKKPKVLTFMDRGENGLSWYRNFIDGPTVIVEDIPSAMRVRKYANAVALLGTGIGTDRAEEIMTHSTTPVVMALDQDATDLSFKWAKKYALLWGDVKVLPLEKDFKDLTEDELVDKLSAILPGVQKV